MLELISGSDTTRVLPLIQAMLEDVPIGLMLVSVDGTPLWFNDEAAIACSVWNGRPQGADALPLECSGYTLPEALRRACLSLVQDWTIRGTAPSSVSVEEPGRGLYALLRLQIPVDGSDPVCYLRLDYRRPRGDRHRELSSTALKLLARLSFREREVAMRAREGLTNPEIGRLLHRSPLTIKTQLAAIYRKLGVKGRTRLAALLNG